MARSTLLFLLGLPLAVAAGVWIGRASVDAPAPGESGPPAASTDHTRVRAQAPRSEASALSPRQLAQIEAIVRAENAELLARLREDIPEAPPSPSPPADATPDEEEATEIDPATRAELERTGEELLARAMGAGPHVDPALHEDLRHHLERLPPRERVLFFREFLRTQHGIEAPR